MVFDEETFAKFISENGRPKYVRDKATCEQLGRTLIAVELWARRFRAVFPCDQAPPFTECRVSSGKLASLSIADWGELLKGVRGVREGVDDYARNIECGNFKPEHAEALLGKLYSGWGQVLALACGDIPSFHAHHWFAVQQTTGLGGLASLLGDGMKSSQDRV